VKKEGDFEPHKDRPYRFEGIAAPIVPTGNMLVKFKVGVSTSEAVAVLRQGNGHVATSSDFATRSFDLQSTIAEAEALVFERIGVAIIHPDDPGEFSSRAGDLEEIKQVSAVVPEFFVFSYDGGDVIHEDTEHATWGVRAVGADRSRFTGKGIKVAILDSGFDRAHPDFDGREIRMWSAFANEKPDEDLQGHGTHCAGTAAGPNVARNRMRYGVAHEADLCIYKVLGNGGYGTDGSVLAGIERALDEGCEVLAMSFGRGAKPENRPNPVFELTAQQALSAGTLIVAAAGNSSSRDIGYRAPIDYPANSPSIMAVGAIDSRLRIANFSAGCCNLETNLDIVAPGSGIFSSWPTPRRYRRLRGTSMAVPHVAGVACLWAQADERLRGRALWRAIIDNACRLNGDEADVGAGLVQAPVTKL
jgi:subtilisin